MDAVRFAKLARQLPDLLDQQMKALAGRNLDLLPSSERAAYEKRKGKIVRLRRELDQLGRPE